MERLKRHLQKFFGRENYSGILESVLGVFRFSLVVFGAIILHLITNAVEGRHLLGEIEIDLIRKIVTAALIIEGGRFLIDLALRNWSVISKRWNSNKTLKIDLEYSQNITYTFIDNVPEQLQMQFVRSEAMIPLRNAMFLKIKLHNEGLHDNRL